MRIYSQQRSGPIRPSAVRRLLSVLLLASLIGIACSGRAAATDEVESEFLRLARDEVAAGGDGDALHDFLASQSAETRLRLARLAAGDPDPRLRRLGAALLVELERYGEAASLLAELLVAGEDLGGLGHQLLHGADEPGLRVYIELSRTLLAERRGYTALQRDRADRFLCRLAGAAEPPCSDAAVEQRLAELEQVAGELAEPPPP